MFVLGKLEPLPISSKPDANVIATANQ